MVTLAPSMYVYIKQQPLSPPPFAPAKAFYKKQICYLFHVLSSAEFSESLTTSGLIKTLQISLEGFNA